MRKSHVRLNDAMVSDRENVQNKIQQECANFSFVHLELFNHVMVQ